MGIQIQRDKYFSGGGGTMLHEDLQKSELFTITKHLCSIRSKYVVKNIKFLTLGLKQLSGKDSLQFHPIWICNEKLKPLCGDSESHNLIV